MAERLIFHVDVNSAFLSWEAARRVRLGEPDLRLIPSAVGGDPRSRTGIITAKSIPAKAYGVTTGEPVALALRKCPELVVVPADFELYVKNSRAFKALCQDYTPVMESFSIDEVFLDMSGTGLLYPDPLELAHRIKDRIRDELGFTVNVGIGRNKLCAKMASDFQKPDRVHTLFPEELAEKMWPLPVEELFTCGRASAERLKQHGIRTIGELARTDEAYLRSLFGEKSARHLKRFANGLDEEPVRSVREEAKGYSAETTVNEDLDSFEKIDRLLLAQADVVSARLRAEGALCGCVAVTWRNLSFVTRSHQRKLPENTDVTEKIYETARELIRERWNGEPLRLLGLALTDIDREGSEQLALFGQERKEKLRRLDRTLDSIRGRFGDDSVMRAGLADGETRINRKQRADRKLDRESRP